jgi:hypothetical protein
VPADLPFCEWAARSLLGQLRAGGVTIELEAGAFVWEPMLTAIRGAADPNDASLVVELLADERLRMFGGLLSRAFLDDPTITASLLACFTSEPDEERQLGLFHQVVARPLGDADTETVAAWAEANADALIAEQRAFFAGADAAERLAHRMSAPEFARKRWVYLYAAHALEDPVRVRAFVDAHRDDDPLMVRAAEASLARLAG